MPESSHVMACMEVWGGNRAIDTSVQMPGLDAWVFSLPFQGAGASEGGGDLHYATSCATGRITRLVVADVSGHGAPVARAAESLRRLMRKHTNTIDQTDLVRRVNREFGQIGQEGIETPGAGVLFATAVVATYFSPTDELAVSNAGHPRPMRWDAKRGEWEMIEPAAGSAGEGPTNLPLGVVEETTYPATSVRLRPEDLVLFYTDSLIEAMDREGVMLGHEGLRRMLGEVDPSRPEALVRELLGRIAARAGGGDPSRVFNDDVTALLVRRNAFKVRPSLGGAILAGGRIIREAVRSLVPGGLPAAFPAINVRSIGGAMSQSLNGEANTPEE